MSNWEDEEEETGHQNSTELYTQIAVVMMLLVLNSGACSQSYKDRAVGEGCADINRPEVMKPPHSPLKAKRKKKLKKRSPGSVKAKKY